MRILIVGLGGISRHFRNWPERTLGAALVRAGHEVHAITYHQPQQPHLGLEARHETIDGVQVWRVRPALWPNRDLARTLARLPRPDMIHLMHPRNVLAFGSVAWARRQAIPTAWTWLGPYHDQWLVPDRERPYESTPHPERLIFAWPQLLRRIAGGERGVRWRDHWRNYAIHQPLAHVDGLLPCSQHEAEVLATMGLGAKPCRVVPLWLDDAFMASGAGALPQPLSAPIIPYIGQLTPRKGYDLLVEAMPAVVARHPAASFVFVTHNPAQRAELQALAAARGVSANLHFLGTISEEQKLALLRASALLPFPSRYEGFGLPVLEGMAAGVPVIASNIPVLNELIRAGTDGLLIPYNDHAALARAMLRLLEDEPLRQRLIAGGKVAMAERFASERLVHEVIDFYAALIAGRAGPLVR